MSNELAIAACTAAMSRLLRLSIPDVPVTTLPLDRASQEGGSSRLNLFLYHTAPNAAWRNQPMPDRVRPSQHGRAPLALNLYYLLTAFGDDQDPDKVFETDHQLLGKAMTLFHSVPVLLPKEIEEATDPDGGTTLSRSDLHKQVERVRLTPEPISIDDMMKLWGTFHQSPYRISSAWQASVVLLERDQRDTAPFPVFFRGGEGDPGPNVQAELPTRLENVEYRDTRTSERELGAAQLGDVITVRGSNIRPSGTELLILDRSATRDSDPGAGLVGRFQPIEGSDAARFVTRITETPALISGRLLAVLESTDGALPRKRRTNPVELRLAPRLTADDSETSIFNGFVTFSGANPELKLICTPPPGPDRDVSLFLTPTDERSEPPPIPALARAASDPPDEVRFDVSSVPSGRYRVRLSVDMVESMPIRRVGDAFEIDQRQEVQLG